MNHGLDIEIYQGRHPQLGKADIRVVIDVIRAFTTTHILLRCGARRILLADTVEQARQLAAASSQRLLAGERNALAPEGFDYGNSPAQMSDADVEGREVVLTTSNGVRATVHALFEGPVLVTGFSNAGAAVDALQRLVDEGARTLQLIASHPDGDEDMACAQWIRARLFDEEQPDDGDVVRRIRHSKAAQKFLDPSRPEYRAGDIDLCARRDDAPWAMIVGASDEAPTVERKLLEGQAP